MYGDTGLTKSGEKTEVALENNVNQPEQKRKNNQIKSQQEKKNFCYVCLVQCTSNKNFKEHQSGQKHLKKLNSPQQDTKKKANKKNNNHYCKPSKKVSKDSQQDTEKNTKKNNNKNYSKPSKKVSKNSLQSSSANSKEKAKNFEETATDKTMNYFRNRYTPNNKYNNPDFGNRYPKHNNSNNYGNEKHYYNNTSYNWDSYSNSPRMPNAQNYNFNYRYGNQFHSQSGYKQYPLENNQSFFNSFRNYGESSNSGIFEQNLEHVNCTGDPSHHFENPFKQFYSKDVILSSKSHKEKLGNETGANNTHETHASSTNEPAHFLKDPKCASKNRIVIDNTLETNVRSTNERTHFSKGYMRDSKKNFVISKTRGKRTIFRSRSLSSSESDRKRKAKSDHTESEESEEQRIQEWTNSLLETNHNQITRLINPSNHKEKAAVNHLITKFSKSKRKENLTRTLRTNSSELTDNDDKDARTEVTENEPFNVEEDEISIVLDSKITNSNLEESVTNICTASANKFNNFKCNTNQDENNKNTPSISSIKKNFKICGKKGKNVKDNNITSNKTIMSLQMHDNSNPIRYKEKYVKRKSSDSDTKVRKKQKAISLKSLDAMNGTESENLNKQHSRQQQAATSKNFCSPVNTKTSDQNSASEIKPEMVEALGEIGADPSSTAMCGDKLEENLIFSSDVSVETLIQLFASGNVKVKEEFNDPVMDALKEISPDELINACSNSINTNKESANKATTNSANKKHSKDKSLSENHKNNDCINPEILGSTAIEDNESLVSAFIVNNSDQTSSVSENMCSPSLTPQTEPMLPTESELLNHSSQCTNVEKDLNDPLLNLNDLNNTKVELPPYINKLIKELKDVTSEEEKVKENLIETKSKINEYATLLEEWKRRKKMLQEREECLRVQRNDVIKLMQNSVKTDNDDNETELAPSLPENDTLNAQSTSKEKQNLEDTDKTSEVSEPSLTVPPPADKKKQKQKESESSPRSPESDEIVVIPAPEKPQPVEIVICDDDENVPSSSKSKTSRYALNAIISPNKRTSMYDLKSINAHATVINCLVVFEDFLYTCSNDNTARRFSLKDASLSVTYFHSAKNVTEIVVEKVQNEALVFTSCSTRVVSLFIASSGTKIKSFFPPCAVMSICKGWGKFYSGLANGSVNVYNWKYEEIEIVKTEQPASRIATAYQGRLHVLVILSSEGNISIRDAETGLLIRYVKISIKHPSWMCLHNDLVYLSSSDKTLSILDIMSGRIEKKLYLNCHTTGLSVYDDFIFTISYSGVINCYNKDNSCDKKVFYGAGKGALTCVHVYQNRVFTGNRRGEVSLFHFDPSSYIACEFSKCDAVYGLKDDLEYHIEKDHLLRKKLLSYCCWKGCVFKFPRGADLADKMNHIKTHIYPMNCTPSNVSS